MATDVEKPNGFPVLICGLARAGTSFLHSALAGHEYLRNDNFPDKELRYFETFLGERPWGKIDAVSSPKYAGIDDLIVPEVLRRIHELLRQVRGGPHGHYLIANPNDIFYSEFILNAVPEAKFLVCLRDPLTNVWSKLNYPHHTWGQRDKTGRFREADIRKNAEHWTKVVDHLLKHKLHERHERFLIIEQERLAEGDPEFHQEIERFLGIRWIGSALDRRAGLVVHSTFLSDRNVNFASSQERFGHFQKEVEMLREEPQFIEIVMSTCQETIIQLQALGLLKRGPSAVLVKSFA